MNEEIRRHAFVRMSMNKEITVLMGWPFLVRHFRTALSVWREAHKTRVTRYGVAFTIKRKS